MPKYYESIVMKDIMGKTKQKREKNGRTFTVHIRKNKVDKK